MTDTEFRAWIDGWCYAKQGEGYGQGTPPDGFAPIIIIFTRPDGTYDRQRMLEHINIAKDKKLILGGSQ